MTGPRYRAGLVVGKFAPLHTGHELLIRRALSECERLVILSYARPEFEGCGPVARERWLRQSFPEAQICVLSDEVLAGGSLRAHGFASLPDHSAPESVHRRFVGAVCVHRLGVAIDVVWTSEAYGDGLARELTEYYRLANSDYPTVAHVCVDPERSKVPISATRVRADVHAARRYLPDHVYASFVERVVLLGGESSGKSTLSRALARHFDTAWVAEYGRELWEQQDGRLDYADFEKIAVAQVAREEAALACCRRYLFCDTSPLTTRMYSQFLFGKVAPKVEALAARSYHHTVLCAPDFPFVQDGTRQESGFRDEQHRRYRRELAARGIAHITVGGSLVQRVKRVAGVLREASIQQGQAARPT